MNPRQFKFTRSSFPGRFDWKRITERFTRNQRVPFATILSCNETFSSEKFRRTKWDTKNKCLSPNRLVHFSRTYKSFSLDKKSCFPPSWYRCYSSSPTLSINPLLRIRNVGIIAHIDAGKTTISERMLFLCDKIPSIGNIDTGDTTLDFMDQERERGITIQSAAISLEWRKNEEEENEGYQINLIDTPGHVDFTIEVERALRVLDGAVVVIDAVAGVQAQTETVWKQAKKNGLPCVLFVNKMDRDGADFYKACASVYGKLNRIPVPLQIPIQSRDGFEGVVDLLTLEKVQWKEEENVTSQPQRKKTNNLILIREQLIPPENSKSDNNSQEEGSNTSSLYQKAIVKRTEMLEILAELDDEFMELYLNAMEDNSEQLSLLPVETILPVLRRLCLRNKIFPTVCGSALKGKGVEILLDCMGTFLPCPIDKSKYPIAVKKLKTKRATQKIKNKEKQNKSNEIVPDHEALITIAPQDEALCLYVFKVVFDRRRGPIVYARIYSGELKNKDNLYNSNQGCRERPLQLLNISADDLEIIDSVKSGQTIAIVGLKNTKTGDTLVHFQGPYHGAILAGIDIPEPVFSLSIEPESSADQDDFEEALKNISIEDPSLKVTFSDTNKDYEGNNFSLSDNTGGQTLISGMGELHLEVIQERLKRDYGIEVQTGEAYVAYREGLIDDSDIQTKYIYDKIIGGKESFAELELHIRSLSTSSRNSQDSALPFKNIEIENKSEKNVQITYEEELEDILSPEELNSILEGLSDVSLRGPIKGYPLMNIQIHVASAGRNDSTTPGAMRACAVMAMNNALAKENTCQIMEPIMALEITTNTESIGAIVSDLINRGGSVLTMDTQENEEEDEENQRHFEYKQRTIRAVAPLSQLMGYSTTIRSLSSGNGNFSLEFSHYSPMTKH